MSSIIEEHLVKNNSKIGNWIYISTILDSEWKIWFSHNKEFSKNWWYTIFVLHGDSNVTIIIIQLTVAWFLKTLLVCRLQCSLIIKHNTTFYWKYFPQPKTWGSMVSLANKYGPLYGISNTVYEYSWTMISKNQHQLIWKVCLALASMQHGLYLLLMWCQNGFNFKICFLRTSLNMMNSIMTQIKVSSSGQHTNAAGEPFNLNKSIFS